jgi:hypothetical protein
MAYPLLVDERDGLQVWRIAVNMLNMQSWTADNRWSFSLGIGQRLVDSLEIDRIYGMRVVEWKCIQNLVNKHEGK